MRNLRLIHLALLFLWISGASDAATTTSAAAKGAPTSTAVSIEHDLPHPIFEEAEVLFAGGWTIKLLPANLVPLQASRDGEVVLLRDPADNSYYRWYAGSLENLGQSSDDRVSMNNAGITAATNYRRTELYYHSFVKRWRRDDKTFDYLYNPILFSKYTPPLNNGETPASTRYSRNVSLLQVDDESRLWVVADEAAGGPSMIATVDRFGTLRKVYATNSAGVSRTGHSLASVADESGHWKYYLDERQVDFEPTFVNDNGIATAYALTDTSHNAPFIVYPDGRQEPVPKDPLSPSGSPIVLSPWIDSQGRLNGMNNRGYAPVVVQKRHGSDGEPLVPAEYFLIPYEALPFPAASKWRTDHLISPGTFALQLGIAVDTESGVSRPFVATRSFGMAVDGNRDGKIAWSLDDSSDFVSADRPYHFWANDDDDGGETRGTDVPMGIEITGNSQMGLANWQGSGTELKVNGVRDLVDLFPVFLDLKGLIAAFPPGPNQIYKLKQEDSALNFVYTGLTSAAALDYQREATSAIFGPELNQEVGRSDKHWITQDGVDLFSATQSTGSRKFLDAIQNHGGGVILVEGRKPTDKPLVLRVERLDGSIVAETKLELKISPVEKMFRHLNLRTGSDAPPGLIGTKKEGHEAIATDLTEPRDDFPDDPGEPRWLVFVHGYNVSGQKARGWNSELFKRFYWSRSKARFVGVTWFGNPGTGDLNFVKEYHWAVRNAVPSAQALARKLNDLPGIKTVVGHSQGCWLTTLAVADYSLSITNLCLIDAAFGRECFDGQVAIDKHNMVPTEWQVYPPGMWSANWYLHFVTDGDLSSDARSKLTWNERLTSAITQAAVHSFYSSTEDVLATYPGTPTAAIVENIFNAVTSGDLSKLGNYAWVAQEKTKGAKAALTQGSDYAGWGANLTDRPVGSSDPIYYWINGAGGRFLLNPSELPLIDSATIRRAPVFDPGYGRKVGAFHNYDPSILRGPTWIQQLYDTTSDTTSGGTIALANRAELLAEAFPAISLAVGANETPSLQTNNYNMPVQYVNSASWPRGLKSDTGVAVWHHSDVREVAYIHLYRLFDKLSSISNQSP